MSNVGEPKWIWIPRDDIQVQERKKNKFRRCLFTLYIKRKIRHLHIVVVQKWQRNAKIKAWCTCKVVVLLINPIVFLKFSLPYCRWIFVVITWTRMLDGKANGCSQWFLSHRSVASGLEKPLLAGYVLFCIWGQFSKYKPPGAYIWRGDLTEGFLRYRFGGLTFGGAYFRNFTVFYFTPWLSNL